MRPETFKPLLERDKAFLEELYCSQSTSNSKRLLNFASDSKLNTVLKFLHFLASGQIKMKKEHFETIPKRLISVLRKSFEKKNSIRALLNSERQSKIKHLFKLTPVLKELLYPLFNET